MNHSRPLSLIPYCWFLNCLAETLKHIFLRGYCVDFEGKALTTVGTTQDAIDFGARDDDHLLVLHSAL